MVIDSRFRSSPCFVLLVLLVAQGARANRPHSPSGIPEHRVAEVQDRLAVLEAAGDEEFNAARAADDVALASFVKEAGGTWHARYDRRTNGLSFLWGSGLPSFPGRGNSLTWSKVGLKSEPADREGMLVFLRDHARALMSRHPSLVTVPAGTELELDPLLSGSLDGGRIWYLRFAPSLNGVPVQDASLVFRYNSGNLVQLGGARLHASLSALSVVPSLSPGAALELASLRLQDLMEVKLPLPRETVLDSGTLHALPVAEDPRRFEGLPGEGLSYRLAYRVSWRTASGPETWLAWVDAQSGEVLSFTDDNRYDCPAPSVPQGRVSGGVYIGPIEETPQVVRGLPFALVQNGGNLTSDYNGNFPLDASQAAETGLDGTFFPVNCVNCVTPPQALVSRTGDGELFLGMGGQDEMGNGFSTSSERVTFYALNQVRQLAQKNLDDAAVGGFFSRPLDVNVNIEDNCNAFFNGTSVNFFRSGRGCNNSGDIPDVAHHEWGHGIDGATGRGDGSRGEAVGDICSFLVMHDPHNSPYFFMGNPFEPSRTADSTLPGIPFKSASTVGGVCPVGGNLGPYGTEIHCEAGIFTQAVWRMGASLRAKYNDPGGWFVTERLFFQSLPMSSSFVPDQMDSAYDAFILVDDDDGDLTSTPNAAEINEAFLTHEIASTPQAADGPECTPLNAPALTLEQLTNPTTEKNQVRVSWADVPGAVQYELYRNEAVGFEADIPVATLFPPAVDFLDDNITDGVEYHYRLMVLDAGGCFSIEDNISSIDIAPVAHLALRSWTLDDSGVSANANGVPEPGEILTMSIEAENLVGGPATGITATLSSTQPGVTVLTDTVLLGDLLPGESAMSVAPHFVLSLDPGLECAEVITLTVDIEATEGCTSSQVVFLAGRVDLIEQDNVDFEIADGWTVDPDGTDDATTGIWVRENPNGTTDQLEDDHTPGGTIAWVTGNDPDNGAGTDDVDGGCTTLQSRVFDFGGRSGLVLSYWRYWTIRTTFDDEFAIDISNDGGANWQPLERIANSLAGWQEALHDLDDVLGAPADRVALRFIACDNGGGSLLEAMVDDVVFSDAVPDCESASPRSRLVWNATVVGDSPAFGGIGNGNGFLDPGETVRLAVDLQNVGSMTATNVEGIMTSLSLPEGVLMTDDLSSWPDVAVGAIERTGTESPEHFEFWLTRPLTACEGSLSLDLDVSYEGGADGPYALNIRIDLPVGEPGLGGELSVIVGDDFESGENGWTHAMVATQDDWHYGAPAAAGDGSAWDPTAAASGSSCWGNDLGGTRMGQPWNGDYGANVDNFLESPAIDCSTYPGVKLKFMRWLTVEDGAFDQAYISVNGVEIWQNPAGADLIDTSWVEQEFDITALAGGQASVVIRFGLRTDGGLEYGGWNIDDVELIATGASCTGVLGCEIFPTPGPTGPELRATGLADDDGAEFEWPGATLETDAHFQLFRGETPLTVDTQVTPADYLGTSFDDRAAPAGLYYYLLYQSDCAGFRGPR